MRPCFSSYIALFRDALNLVKGLHISEVLVSIVLLKGLEPIGLDPFIRTHAGEVPLALKDFSAVRTRVEVLQSPRRKRMTATEHEHRVSLRSHSELVLSDVLNTGSLNPYSSATQHLNPHLRPRRCLDNRRYMYRLKTI